MTRQRKYEYENKFLDWIRTVRELDSYDGYRVYDIDSVMWRVQCNTWILLETKTHKVGINGVKPHQRKTLEVLHRSLDMNPEVRFCGTYLLTFENTCPQDGYTHITKFDGTKWIESGVNMDATMFTHWLCYILNRNNNE